MASAPESESSSGLTMSQVLQSPFLLALFSGSAFALILILVGFCVLAASFANSSSNSNNNHDKNKIQDKGKHKRNTNSDKEWHYRASVSAHRPKEDSRGPYPSEMNLAVIQAPLRATRPTWSSTLTSQQHAQHNNNNGHKRTNSYCPAYAVSPSYIDNGYNTTTNANKRTATNATADRRRMDAPSTGSWSSGEVIHRSHEQGSLANKLHQKRSVSQGASAGHDYDDAFAFNMSAANAVSTSTIVNDNYEEDLPPLTPSPGGMAVTSSPSLVSSQPDTRPMSLSLVRRESEPFPPPPDDDDHMQMTSFSTCNRNNNRARKNGGTRTHHIARID